MSDWKEKKMLITEIEKNPNEKIRVSIAEYRNSRFIDCRVYYLTDNGDWLPTKKGIALNSGVIDGVIKALEEAKVQFQLGEV